MLVADVFDVILVDNNGDIAGTTTLQDASIDVKVKSNDVNGGKGNPLIAILHSGRDITINLTDVEWNYEFLAKQLGQDIVTGAGVAWAMPKWYVADASKTITLDFTPLASNSGLKLYKTDGSPLVVTTDYTIATNKITLVTGAAGDNIEVRGYKYNTDAKTETLEIDNTKFAKGLGCYLETLEIDEEENPTYRLQYQFDSAIPTGEFTVSTKSDKNAATQQFNLRVLKPKNSTVVGRALRIPYVEKQSA